MAAEPRLICASEALVERGDGVRFELELAGEVVPAFAIRYNGRVHAYVNRCAHVPIELDWLHGAFFDMYRHLLICSTHGALYDPATGHCVGGPCRGGRLKPVRVCEREGGVWLEGETPVEAASERRV